MESIGGGRIYVYRLPLGFRRVERTRILQRSARGMRPGQQGEGKERTLHSIVGKEKTVLGGSEVFGIQGVFGMRRSGQRDSALVSAFLKGGRSETAKEQGVSFKAIHIQNKEEAQNAPTPITTYALFFEGVYLTNEQMNDKRFLKLLAHSDA